MNGMSIRPAFPSRRPLSPELALHGPGWPGAAGGEALARDMLGARQRRQPLALPLDSGADLTPQQGYELQALHAQSVLASIGGRLLGTRIGARDMASLAALGLSGPMRGPLFSATAHRSPATLPRAEHLVCRIELAIAVRLREDVGGHPYLPGRDVLQHAIGAVLPAIDVLDSRLTQHEQRPLSMVLADLCYGGAWVHGEAVTDWQDLDLAGLKPRLFSDGRDVRAGTGVDPLHALSLLVADLGREGRSLRAGEIVSVGPCTAAYAASAGESLRADFGPLGEVELRLT
jgi:2-oxo-hept-3-ene-1,7-dioate hydratase